MSTSVNPETHTKAGIYHPECDILLLRASKTNPRKHFDQGKLEELAASLREHGVIQALTARRAKGNTAAFEIVAGERRYRAAQLANIKTLPVLERVLTDEQVVEIQLIENIQRDDLTALEQARGYRSLIDSNPGKHTAASIATRVGMSEAWVWDRLKLNDLIPDAKELLEGDRMSTGHAILIARQKPADQKRIIFGDTGHTYGTLAGGLWRRATAAGLYDDAKKPGKYDGLQPVSVRELEHWIADHVRFDVAHAAKAVPLEFEAVAAQVEAAAAQPGRGKKVIPITFSYHVQDSARDPDERTYGVQSWERADGKDKSKTCEHSVLGVVAAGSEHYGKAFAVCIARDKCRVHFGKVIAQKEKTAKLRESGQPKKAAAQEKKQESSWEIQQRREAADRQAWEELKPVAIAAVVAKLKPSKLNDAVVRRLVDLLDFDTQMLKKLMDGPVTVKNFTRALDIGFVLEQSWSHKTFAPTAKKHGVDLAKLKKELDAKKKTKAA